VLDHRKTKHPIQLRNGSKLTLDGAPKQVIEIHGVVVVRFASRAFDNVAAFDPSGKQLWKVKPVRTQTGFHPFSEIARVNEGILLVTGHEHLVVDPKTGKVLRQSSVPD
jgi:hypothetical protein